MLEANKSRWAENVFAVYNRNLLRRRFDSFRVLGLELLLENKKAPTIIYANHSSWWDGLIAFQISRRTKSDSFIMMEEKQLADLFVFRKLGAFSVVRENPRQAKRSIDYAVKILSEKPGRKLWIFPQGEILPNDLRPLEFYNGLSNIIKRAGNCRIINLAIKYEFLGAFKPNIFVSIKKSPSFESLQQINKKTISKALAEQLTANLDFLKIDIINNQTTEYQNII
jgi:1-acyl-sn-glycerol-3-phosphate acyltransferase